MTRLRVLLPLLVSLLLHGCISSVHPLSQPGEHPLDPALQGTWYLKMDEEGYLHIAPNKDGTYDLLSVSLKPSGGLEVERFTFYTTRIDGRRYLNMRYPRVYPPPEETDPEPHYEFALYFMEGEDRFYISIMNMKETIKAIEKGTVQGTVHRDMFTTVKLTSTTKDLVHWLKQADLNRLFCQSKDQKQGCVIGPFTRIQPPDTPSILKDPRYRPK